MPRAASASPSSSAGDAPAAPSARGFRFHRSQRLLSTALFARLHKDGDPRLRAGRTWLSLAARIETADSQTAGSVTQKHGPAVQVRFGVTVGKRNARRAVQRALVKRIVREAMRHAAPAIEAAIGSALPRRTVDLVVRLKAPFPGPDAMRLAGFKRALRAEADQLLDGLARRLTRL